MRFQWDDQKAVENLNKHGVSFGEATEVFYDPNALEAYDQRHSIEEARFIIIGLSSRRLLYVVYAERANDLIRIVSARKANRTEEFDMDEQKTKTPRPFVFTVIEDDGVNVTIEVSQEDYEADLAAGMNEDETLKPGRYKMKRGSFLERHPELKLDEKKRA